LAQRATSYQPGTSDLTPPKSLLETSRLPKDGRRVDDSTGIYHSFLDLPYVSKESLNCESWGQSRGSCCPKAVILILASPPGTSAPPRCSPSFRASEAANLMIISAFSEPLTFLQNHFHELRATVLTVCRVLCFHLSQPSLNGSSIPLKPLYHHYSTSTPPSFPWNRCATRIDPGASDRIELTKTRLPGTGIFS
jgi:hypothetical protein